MKDRQDLYESMFVDRDKCVKSMECMISARDFAELERASICAIKSILNLNDLKTMDLRLDFL